MGTSGGRAVVGLCVLALVVMANIGSVHAALTINYYAKSCPNVLSIVKAEIRKAVQADTRMAASLVRLHFHDCFVNGCDGSVLLDNGPGIVDSEKFARGNKDSLRGFEVIDTIKGALEKACPKTVSCADILAIAYRDSAVEVGLVPQYPVFLGRMDGTTASAARANSFLPAPFFNNTQLKDNFAKVGLDETDLVALSGAHTIGLIRCSIVNDTRAVNEKVPSINTNFLKTVCTGPKPPNMVSLDHGTPKIFDNNYFHNLRRGEGVIPSDQVLYSIHGSGSFNLVRDYAESQEKFFRQFAKSSIKMSNIESDNGNKGEVRTNCRLVNKKSLFEPRIAYE